MGNVYRHPPISVTGRRVHGYSARPEDVADIRLRYPRRNWFSMVNKNRYRGTDMSPPGIIAKTIARM